MFYEGFTFVKRVSNSFNSQVSSIRRCHTTVTVEDDGLRMYDTLRPSTLPRVPDSCFLLPIPYSLFPIPYSLDIVSCLSPLLSVSKLLVSSLSSLSLTSFGTCHSINELLPSTNASSLNRELHYGLESLLKGWKPGWGLGFVYYLPNS